VINVSSVSAFVVGCLYRLPADTQMPIGLPSPLYTASKKPFYLHHAPRLPRLTPGLYLTRHRLTTSGSESPSPISHNSWQRKSCH